MKMQSEGSVRRFIEEDNVILVSFDDHDGYFRLTDLAQRDILQKAQREGQKVTFFHDDQLNILSFG